MNNKPTKFICSLMALIFSLSIITVSATSKENIKVTINDEELTFDVSPIIIDGRTLVPMRGIFEALGAAVNWEGSTQTITANTDDIIITMQINNPVMIVNETNITLDVAPQLINSRTLVPARAVAEGLNATVTWDDKTQTVIIETQDKTKIPDITEIVPSPSPLPSPSPSLSPSPIPTSVPEPTSNPEPSVNPEQIDESPTGSYVVETVISKENINKMQYMIYVKESIYFLDNNTLKKYDDNTKTVTTITDFKDLICDGENTISKDEIYSEFIPSCLAYNRYTEKVLVFGEFQKGSRYKRGAVYSIDNGLTLEKVLYEDYTKNYNDITYYAQIYFADADTMYLWSYVKAKGNSNSSFPNPSILNLKSQKLDKLQELRELYKMQVYRETDGIYVFSAIGDTRFSGKISDNIRSNGFIKNSTLIHVASAIYNDVPYFLAEEGTIYKHNLSRSAEVYISGKDVPKDYEIHTSNVRFWQIDGNEQPLWFDKYTGSVKRIRRNLL